MAEDGPSMELHVESYSNANRSTENPVKEVHWLYEWQKRKGLDAIVDYIGCAEHLEVNREGTKVDDRTVKNVGKDGVPLHQGNQHVHVGSILYEVLNPFWLDKIECHLFGCVLVVIVGPPPQASRVAKSSHL